MGLRGFRYQQRSNLLKDGPPSRIPQWIAAEYAAEFPWRLLPFITAARSPLVRKECLANPPVGALVFNRLGGLAGQNDHKETEMTCCYLEFDPRTLSATPLGACP